MGASNLSRRLSVLVACSVVGAAAFVLPAGAAPGGNGGGNGNASGNAQGGGNTNASVNLDQCRNGVSSAPQDCDADGWDNGNLNPNQAHYSEGQSAPYRLVMEGLPLGEAITVVLQYDVLHSGKHAIDFLTHYDRIAEDVVPTDGVTGISATVDSYPIPAPGSAGSPVVGEPTGAFNALPAAERVMTLFGGDINGMAYVSEGNLSSTGNSAAQVSVTFVADSATAVLAWGGHIASSEYWGAGNSASGVSGSPYHMSVVDWTLGNLGNQDRSMQADVVIPTEPEAPAQLTVTKVIDNGDGGTGVIGDFDLLVDGVERAWGTPISLPAGTYTVSEGPHDGYVSTISGACAANGTITLTAGQAAACIITNDDIADNPAPGPDPVDEPGGSGTPGGNSGTNPPADTGVESATETTNTPAPLVQTAPQTANSPALPVQTAPVPSLPTTGSPETPTVPTFAAELPRTGAGVREQSLLGLALLAAGLLTSAIGRRRTRPSDV